MFRSGTSKTGGTSWNSRLLPFQPKNRIIMAVNCGDMKFLSDIRLLLLGLWLGAAVFFIGAAQIAFAILPQRELAGAIVSGDLSLLNYSGLAIAVIMILSSLVGVSSVSRFWLWVERFLLLLLGAACAAGQFVIGFWLSSIRTQIGRPIDEVAADDPLRIQFNTLHQYSEWILFTAIIAALLAFFIVANRKFSAAKPAKSDIYDFSKEFKI
jgi:hypothetical protein